MAIRSVVRFAVLGLAAGACGGEAGANPYRAVAPPLEVGSSPPGTRPLEVKPVTPVAVRPPPGDVCAKPPATMGAVPHRTPDAYAPLAGQMSEEAAQAKRLYDAEKWEAAATALARVASGQTGDDEGNKQLADYHHAIVLFRMGHFGEAATKLRSFARNPAHVKFAESLLWIVRVAREEPASVLPKDVALYTREELARFDNPNQREVFGAASFILGQERYDEGNLSEAKRLFENAKRAGPWPREAEACLEKISATPFGKDL